MKKKLALFCFFSAIFSIAFLNSKEPSTPTVQIKFSSTKIANSIPDVNEQEQIEYFLVLLKNYSRLQEQRKLTLEEMIFIVQILIFLFVQDSDNYSKKIEVAIKGGQKIVLPYSSELLTGLAQLQNQIDQNDDQNNIA